VTGLKIEFSLLSNGNLAVLSGIRLRLFSIDLNSFEFTELLNFHLNDNSSLSDLLILPDDRIVIGNLVKDIRVWRYNSQSNSYEVQYAVEHGMINCLTLEPNCLFANLAESKICFWKEKI